MRRVIVILLFAAFFTGLLASEAAAQANSGFTSTLAAAFLPDAPGHGGNRPSPTEADEGVDVSESVTLPAEWTGLSAFQATDGMMLRWSTSSEVGSAWFKIDARFKGSNGWQVLDIIPAAGESSTPRFYTWRHDRVPAGRIEYRLRQIDAFGNESSTGTLHVDAGRTPDLQLRPCTPNPATTETLVSIANSDTATGQLVIEDADGKLRQIIFKRLELLPGSYRFRVDTSTLPAGLYKLRLDTDAGRRSRDLIVVR